MTYLRYHVQVLRGPRQTALALSSYNHSSTSLMRVQWKSAHQDHKRAVFYRCLVGVKVRSIKPKMTKKNLQPHPLVSTSVPVPQTSKVLPQKVSVFSKFMSELSMLLLIVETSLLLDYDLLNCSDYNPFVSYI